MELGKVPSCTQKRKSLEKLKAEEGDHDMFAKERKEN